MSDFLPRDILPDLWEEILKRHWSYLETEESIQKIEERKKLEGCLKEFLCIVQHDRKFFLPETGHVLSKTIRELNNFTAYKAILAFDAISQYANNLFTKPWRKEYRVLKMYSGFFQHEIQSNLLDAVRLFEAMGYRRSSSDLLVLDGPICPDQVTNVSRDAMAAYVECQIIKQIYSGLLAMGLSCTWQDVYNYREKYVGGSTSAIKDLAYAIQERRLRKEKLINTENSYATIQHAPPTSGALTCHNCAAFHMAQETHGSPGGQALYGGQKMIASYPASSYRDYPQLGGSNAQQQMSHSRSLEHYNEPHALLPHRHSFDHQQRGCTAHHYQQVRPPPNIYESPYDCIDGFSGSGSSVSYAAAVSGGMNAAYAHPYNVSGNRYPLPYNISHQLSSHYAAPATVTCNGVKGERYNSGVDSGYSTVQKTHNSGFYQAAASAPLPPTRHASINAVRQRTYPPEQLIDFDDRAPLTAHDFHAIGQDDCEPFEQHQLQRAHMNPTYAQPKDLLSRRAQLAEESLGGYAYAQPVARGGKTRMSSAAPNTTDKYLRNADLMQDSFDNNRKMPKELNGASGQRRRDPSSYVGQERVASDVSYDSNTFDDFVTVCQSEHPQQLSPSQTPKVKDGFGSFESWNYVFQNLERSGYSKDLGDREDLLVQSLDLDSMNLSSATVAQTVDKRRANNADAKAGRQPTRTDKPLTLERVPSQKQEAKSATLRQEKSILKPQNGHHVAPAGGKKLKSALKPTTSTGADNKGSGYGEVAAAGTAGSAKRGPSGVSGNGAASKTQKATRSLSGGGKQTLPVPTQVIVSSPNEWSCRFCTLLNPDTKRICEMCCRSKDFNIEATASGAPTCV